MSKQFRDVTGGDAVLGDIVPGLNLMNYVLGWFTVPVEVFLRRNFGERYFTQPNFFAGLVVLLLIQLASYIASLLNPFNYVLMFFNHGAASVTSWMGTITKWYIILGIIHFLRIWWNDTIGIPVHSFSAGRSWLRPIGKGAMFLLNLLLDNIVRLIFMVNPKLDKKRLALALPVLQDPDVFTEKFIEPAFVIFVGLIAAAAGQSAVFFWLLFSAMALNLYTGVRHQQERSKWLNIMDSMIEAGYYNQPDKTNQKAAKSHERIVKKVAFEAEQNPNVEKVVERSNPTLADAMKAMRNNPGTGTSSSPNPAMAA